MIISFLLLFVPLQFTALFTGDIGTLKFLINLITHQLAHGNFMHLFGNYLFMIPYALFLENKIGRKRFLAIYLLTGVAAAATQILGAGSPAMVGSSGAAFGIFAAACCMFDETKMQRLAGFIMLGLGLGVQFMLATSIAAIFSNVAYWAHFGGGIAGAALIHFFVKPEVQSSQSKSLRK
jgi:membrane associated rhomboid family serine protease